MNIYIDGKKIDGVETIDFEIEKSEERHKDYSFINKGMSGTLNILETNIRTLSNKTRSWCKQIKWDGKIYW